MHHFTYTASLIICMLPLNLACQPDKRKDSLPPNPPLKKTRIKPDADKARTKKKPTHHTIMSVEKKARFCIFDLLHNRPNAHQIEGDHGFALDAASPGVVRYIDGNHTRDFVQSIHAQGVDALAIRGRRATLRIPSLSKTNNTLFLRVHNPNTRASTLQLKLNGTRLDTIALVPGWQTVQAKVDAKLMRHENNLRVDFTRLGTYEKLKSGGAIAWLKVGDAQMTDTAPDMLATRAQEELLLHKNDGLAWHIWAMPKSILELKTKPLKKPCSLSVRIITQGEAPGTLKLAHEDKFMLTSTDPMHASLNLSSIAGPKGTLVRLELRAHKSCTDPITLTHGKLTLPGTRPKVPKDFEPPKYIILWKSDALRADYLPFYRTEHKVHTPFMSSLAQKGAVFKTAFVQGNESRVSHASLFTGQHPAKHGIHPKGKLRSTHYLLSEAFKDSSWHTGAHASNGYVSTTYGYNQGWNFFFNALREKRRYLGDAMVKRAGKWLAKSKDKNIFLYLGTVDVHVSYRAHPKIIKRYEAKPYRGKYKRHITGMDFRKIWSGELKLTSSEKERVRALYKNEITYNDQALGALINKLKEEGMWEQTMIVITADHGDEIWDHNRIGHGQHLYQELVHVPLVFYYPPAIPKETVVESGADVIDIYPTLLAISGIPRPKHVQGKNLLESIYKVRGDYPEPAVATDELHSYTMQLRQWKIMLRKNHTWRLYNRDTDHYEKKNIIKDHPLAKRWLVDSLSWHRAHRTTWDKSTCGHPNNLSSTFLQHIQP